MSSYVRKKTKGNTDWFVHDRFGMFIHFGLYAMPARHEWVMSRARISKEDSSQYFKHFDPEMFDACQWAKSAKAAGMKVCGVYDDSSREFEEEIKSVTDFYIHDFSELLFIE